MDEARYLCVTHSTYKFLENKRLLVYCRFKVVLISILVLWLNILTHTQYLLLVSFQVCDLAPNYTYNAI